MFKIGDREAVAIVTNPYHNFRVIDRIWDQKKKIDRVLSGKVVLFLGFKIWGLGLGS